MYCIPPRDPIFVKCASCCLETPQAPSNEGHRSCLKLCVTREAAATQTTEAAAVAQVTGSAGEIANAFQSPAEMEAPVKYRAQTGDTLTVIWQAYRRRSQSYGSL